MQAGALQQRRRGKFILRRLLGALKTAGGEASASTGETTSASHGGWSPCSKPRFLLHHSHFTTPNCSLFTIRHCWPALSLHHHSTHNLPVSPRSATTYIHDSTHTTHTRHSYPGSKREQTMAEFAQRVLMNEFKALSKETWTNIEVRRHPHAPPSRGGGPPPEKDRTNHRSSY